MKSLLSLSLPYPPWCPCHSSEFSCHGSTQQPRHQLTAAKVLALGMEAQVCLGPSRIRYCVFRGLYTSSCTCSVLLSCQSVTRIAAVIGIAAGFWPIKTLPHTARPPRIAAEHLSETLSERTGKGNRRSHATNPEYGIYSLLPALTESSDRTSRWTPSLPIRMQKD